MTGKQHPRIKPLPISAIDLHALWSAAFGEEAGQASLSKLATIAKDKRIAQQINQYPDRSKLGELFNNCNPKIRKNTARLMSVLSNDADLAILLNALQREETLFVIPSIVLAMGQFEDERCPKALEDTLTRISNFDTPENQKHIAEIRKAVQTVLTRNQKRENDTIFTGLDNANVELLALPECGDLLEQEAKKVVGFRFHRKDASLIIPQCNYQSLFQLRCFTEALIPLKTPFAYPDSFSSVDLSSWAQGAAESLNGFVSLITNCLSPAPIWYRIELRGIEHSLRSPIAHALSKKLDAMYPLVNSTSQYDVELRLCFKDNTLRTYAKLYCPKDPRFLYRTRSLPASIHPVAAASVVQFAKPYLKENARVIDPCCGSGTLLIERAIRLPIQEGLGVDKDQRAIAICRKNIKEAQAYKNLDPLQAIGGDLTSFQPNAAFDELITNLPFGTRVGTHNSTVELYQSLFARLQYLLKPDGVAILFTTQRSVLLRLAKRFGWKLIASRRFTIGGLQPWCLIFERI